MIRQYLAHGLTGSGFPGPQFELGRQGMLPVIKKVWISDPGNGFRIFEPVSIKEFGEEAL